MRGIMWSMSLSVLALGSAPALVRADTPPVRPAAFAQCAACHSTERGKTAFGPSLAAVSGRRAGSLPGYAYSPALKSSGLTWNAATLDRWLASPQQTVPGTRMPFGGMADPTQRKQVVDYLLMLK